MDDMYKNAVRNDYRFATPRGQVTVGDLFHIPLTGNGGMSLNDIAIGINNELKTQEVTFVGSTSTNTKVLEAKLELVKDVIKTRVEEIERMKTMQEVKEKKEKIAEIIQHKKDQAMQDMSVEELEALLKE